MNIKTYTTDTIISVAKKIKSEASVLTDATEIKYVMNEVNPECKNVIYTSRKELHDYIKSKQPDILILLKHSEKTFKFTSEVSPNTQVYVLETDEDEKRISRDVDELEDMK